ncbi:MAG: hypothetical protein HYX59_08855 [Elusimicrobia bacterium]|nr:hypothetical protein [Elusimicrobiota bacterium]
MCGSFAVAAALLRRGGTVVKTEGEAVMASFPTAEAGVRAAADIRARLGDLRAAIAPAPDAR